MAEEAARPHRTKILLAAAGVILLFTFADVAALGKFSPLAFGARLVWAALTVVAALMLERASERVYLGTLFALGVGTSAFFALLTYLTGGASSPLFHWILAMPLLIAVIVQDHPNVTVASAVTMVAGGLLLLLAGHAAPEYVIPWVIQASAMSALAWYASATYSKLRAREAAANAQKLEALQRAKAFDVEAALRKKAEEEVRSRDDFLSVASHELKTPLTSLTLQVQSLLAKQNSTDDHTHAKLEVIDRQVRRLTLLLQELFDLSRLRQRQLEMNYSEVDLCELVRDSVARMLPVAEQVDSELRMDLCSSLTGQWDRTRLEQVVTNLLSNAVKYGAGKPIRVRVDASADRATLTVTDEGIGIASKDQERIFERFERAVSASNYGGLGLGLWISKEIVNGFGGEITVESEPGRGAKFTVTLPRRPAESRLAH